MLRLCVLCAKPYVCSSTQERLYLLVKQLLQGSLDSIVLLNLPAEGLSV